ncbi:DNA-processing protein DprA [Bifidobacterium choloepi]|uniref:DNA-processing protein DprA n=1 Tax=Bifidobacterium choloepi TaxID=2614131 RepID=UPI0018C8883C|nr:DNA-processing protein DprA [Bifidobacterium choloepi]
MTTTIPEPLARAVLSAIGDGADALMVALLRGMDGGGVALLDELTGLWRAPDDRRLRIRLDDRFGAGLACWGRRAGAAGLDAFGRAVNRWLLRLDRLLARVGDGAGPDNADGLSALRAWATADGAYRLVVPGDDCWPSRFADLSVRSDWAPPVCLWVRGAPDALVACDMPVAIVGSRAVNDAGRHIAGTLASNLAAAGHTVVSGGAMGTDAAAHRGVVDMADRIGTERCGRTVAFFAGGLDHAGPSVNLRLFDRIVAAGGALATEMAPGTVPEAHRFLMRNRLIAALADSIVVAQARLRSGALNTANWANDLNRNVWAAPGSPLDADSSGCNRLIADQRAVPLLDVADLGDLCHPAHLPHVVSRDDVTGTVRSGGAVDDPWSRTVSPSGSRPHAVPDIVAMPHARQPQLNLMPAVAAGPGSAADPSADSAMDSATDPAMDSVTDPATDLDTDPAARVVAAIRRCRRRGAAATPDNVLATFNGRRPAGAPPLDAGEFASLLGRLELDGVIRRQGTLLVA